MKTFGISRLSIDDLNEDEERILRKAVELSCHDLVDVHDLDVASLNSITGVLARALMRMFRDGSRSPVLLAEHATARAPKSLRKISLGPFARRL